MKKTDYKINGQEVSYDLTENGYMIYLGGKLWITQNEPYIPYPDLGYEESCLKQIEEIATVQEPEPTQLDRIEETVSSTALTTEYMACLQEINSETV